MCIITDDAYNRIRSIAIRYTRYRLTATEFTYRVVNKSKRVYFTLQRSRIKLVRRLSTVDNTRDYTRVSPRSKSLILVPSENAYMTSY